MTEAPSARASASAERTRTYWRMCGSMPATIAIWDDDQPSGSTESLIPQAMCEPPGPSRRTFKPFCMS